MRKVQTMLITIADILSNSSQESRIHFYERLTSNLTLCVREIYYSNNIDQNIKLDLIRIINEIMHKILTHLISLKLERLLSSEIDTWKSITHWIEQAQSISNLQSRMEWAIIASYKEASLGS
jgi:hypothetical protein